MANTKQNINYVTPCDCCGKDILCISGRLAEELHNIINNNTRFVDNTEILCPSCELERLKEVKE